MVGYNEFFSREAKKKDLSDKSKDGQDSKKVKENDSLSSLPAGLNSPELPKLLVNCLKNIENQKGAFYFP